MTDTFDESLTQFHKFLQQNRHPPNIVWLTANDVVATGKSVLYVWGTPAIANEHLAREAFEAAAAQKRGVSFEALWNDGSVTFCHAWMPCNDDEAARYMMPKEGLKMSVSTGEHRPIVQMVNSRIRWVFLRLRYRRYQHLCDWLFNIER